MSYFDKSNGLTIHSLEAEFYRRFGAYREKHGGKWTEQGEGGQLQAVYLQFPPGTACAEIPSDENHERHQIPFLDGAILFWRIQRTTGLNSISIPYIYL